MNLLLSLSHVLDYRSTSTKALLVGSLLSLTMPLCLKAHVVTPKEAENICSKNILSYLQKNPLVACPSKAVTAKMHLITSTTMHKIRALSSFLEIQNMGEILAYSNENALDTTNLHPGIAQLLNSYKMAFKAISTNNAVETEAKKGTFSPKQ